jgi:hypothetical protein
MYKSIQAEPWIADPRTPARSSNYLYFPLYGARPAARRARHPARRAVEAVRLSQRLLGEPRHRRVYAFVHRLTGERASPRWPRVPSRLRLRAAAGGDQRGHHAGLRLVLASMLLAGLWFDRPTCGACRGRRLFTLGWLVEWRLIFPTLPALLLALAIAARAAAPARRPDRLSAGHRGRHAGIVHSSGGSMRRAVDLHDLLWTGKGIDTGWGGLSWGKAWMMLAASAAILVALGHGATPVTAQHAVLPLVAAGAGRAGDLHRLRRVWWRIARDPRLRAIAVVFLGTLAAGEVLNLYSQPHDPQMQVNVMAWLTVAWALLLWRRGATRNLRRAGGSVLRAADLNTVSFARFRGGDAEAVAALATLERISS